MEYLYFVVSCKCTELVRKLLANNGQTYANAFHGGLGERGANTQPVDEVVQAVAENDHPRDRRDQVQVLEIVRVTVIGLVAVFYLRNCIVYSNSTT